MKICPSCKEEIKDDANVCKHCGQEQDTEEVREMHRQNYKQELRTHHIKGVVYYVIPFLVLCYFLREDIMNIFF